jgi:phosphohistidine phosphatase SixA
MNRKLLIIRHADTENKPTGGSDHERELTIKGKSEALQMAAKIEQLGWTPRNVLCSDAVRAKQTWQQMSEVFDTSAEVSYTNALYLADLDQACDELFALDEDIDQVALIGHNPGWEHLVRWLSGVAVRMSPGTAVLLVGVGDSWADALRQNKWQLEEAIQPQHL